MIEQMIKGFVWLLMFGSCTTGSQDRPTLDAMPQAAAATVRHHAGGVAIHKMEREVEGGVELYEAMWFVAGKRHEAKVTADGKLVELEVEVAEADVPELVRATARRELGSSAKYERLMSGVYEAEVVVNGKEKEIVIAADGSVIGREPEEDDGEEDDD